MLALSSRLSTHSCTLVIQPKANIPWHVHQLFTFFTCLVHFVHILGVILLSLCAEALSICDSKALIIQEFVEHDMELRLYVVNGEAQQGTAETHTRD